METAVSSSCINADVKAVMALGGIRSGHSAHSMRRSALIHAQAKGANTEQLLDMALISTTDVLKRKYLDLGRHVTGCQRASKRTQAAVPSSLAGE